MISHRESKRAVISVQSLLADLKHCTTKRDLQLGKRIHEKAMESRNDSNMSVIMALIKMYAKCGSMLEAHSVFDTIQNPDVVSWTSLLLGYVENGNGYSALRLFSRMKELGCDPDSVTYIAALKACMSLAANGDGNSLQRGRDLHMEIGDNSNGYLRNTLIGMYAKCGSMAEARSVFDSINKPDVVAWNTLLLGYAENGEGVVALDLFSRMKTNGCLPDSVTYVSVLKACTALAENADSNGKKAECLERGRNIHSGIGSHVNLYVMNTLIDMYAKCGSMMDARSVFDSIQIPDVVSWTALVLGYAENGEGHVALDVFSTMKARRCVPNTVTYVAALKACTSLADGSEDCLDRVRALHDQIGSRCDRYLMNTLIDTYAKCGSMAEARRVFDAILNPDVVSWNALLLGYADNGNGYVALELLSRMEHRGFIPNSVTYVAALKAVSSMAANADASVKASCLERGKDIHSEIGSFLVHNVQGALIDMYSKCGSMVEAQIVFDSIQNPDVVSWTALILGYADNGEGRRALDLFSRMKLHGCIPNSVTYVAAVKACSSIAASGDYIAKHECLDRGKAIHSQIGSHLTHNVQGALVGMYAKCGSMVDARTIFEGIPNPDVVSWTTLLLGYVENGEGHVTLDLFSRMKASGCAPNSVTYVAALKACCLAGDLNLGRKLHTEMTDFTAPVVTCLVDLYAKCGSMAEARKVFDMNPKARGIATWNALLTGYGRFGDSESVFKMFEAMRGEGLQPDPGTFVCILWSCSHAGIVEKAREYFDAMTVRYGVTPTVMHYTCMVDVLGRANQMNEAIAMIRKMPCNPDGVTWTALLGACRKWKNVEIGRLAFQALVALDKNDPNAHVVLAHIYGSRGMWEEQGKALEAAKLKLEPPNCNTVTKHVSELFYTTYGKEDILLNATATS